METTEEFLSKKDQEEIVEAIRLAEKNTSGEIRVHIEQENLTGEENRSREIFTDLKMYQTKDRNAVLFHVTINQKTLSIYGDEGINACVQQQFWDELRDEMVVHFKAGKQKTGLVEAILKTGEKLKEYFPYQTDDLNELDDEITFS